MSVQFEEQTLSPTRHAQKVSHLQRILLRNGIVYTPRQATYMLIGLVIVLTVSTIILWYTSGSEVTSTEKWSDIPPEVQDHFLKHGLPPTVTP